MFPRLLVGSVLAGLWSALWGLAPAAAPLTLERKIELPDVRGRIDHLTVDPKSRRLFVAALGNDTVEVIDLGAGRRAQTLRGLAEPQGVLVLPELDRLVVANGRDGSVRTFDATSLAPQKSFPVGEDADNLRRGTQAGLVWVGYGAGGLRSIDLMSNTLGKDIPLGAHPESFQLEQHGARAFVNLPDAKKLAVVDLDRARFVTSWTTGDAAANFPMALDEAEKRLFVVCRTPPRLLVYNSESGTMVGEQPTVGDADDIFYDSTARRLYVSGGDGAVVVYRQQDADHYPELTRLPTAKGARTSLFSPELSQFYVAARRDGQAPAAIWVYSVSR